MAQSRVCRGCRRRVRSVRAAILRRCHTSLLVWSEKERCGALRLAGAMPDRSALSRRLHLRADTIILLVYDLLETKLIFFYNAPRKIQLSIVYTILDLLAIV